MKHQEIQPVEICPKKDLKFSGIKEITVGAVEIPAKYKAYESSEAKVNKLIVYYHKNGHIDKPIIVLCKNDKYVLQWIHWNSIIIIYLKNTDAS